MTLKSFEEGWSFCLTMKNARHFTDGKSVKTSLAQRPNYMMTQQRMTLLAYVDEKECD